MTHRLAMFRLHLASNLLAVNKKGVKFCKLLYSEINTSVTQKKQNCFYCKNLKGISPRKPVKMALCGLMSNTSNSRKSRGGFHGTVFCGRWQCRLMASHWPLAIKGIILWNGSLWFAESVSLLYLSWSQHIF